MSPVFYLLVPLIAFLYASVGFGGATGYLAVMSFYGFPSQVMASTALVLNILVAGTSFISYYRAGHLRRDLLFPFLISSVPAAFIGGNLNVTEHLYTILLYSILTFVAIRLVFFSKSQEETRLLIPVAPGWAFALGLGIGFLSGMVGIGGGIFLSPIIIFARWGSSKQASAVAAAFIVLNSISGLLGRVFGGTFALDTFSLYLLPLGVGGALVGSYFGAQRLSGTNLRRMLGLVMSIVVTNFWQTYWR